MRAMQGFARLVRSASIVRYGSQGCAPHICVGGEDCKELDICSSSGARQRFSLNCLRRIHGEAANTQRAEWSSTLDNPLCRRTRACLFHSQIRHPVLGIPPSQRVRARCLFTELSKDHATLQTLPGSDAGIQVLVLHRPEARNAVGDEMLHQLRSIVEKLRFDSSARVLIICSAVPGVFCSGADIKERRTKTPSEVQKFVTTLRSTFTAIEGLPIPSIAVLEGAALGGGLEMALSCDMRVCGMNAILGLPETSLAIIPGAGGTQRLPRLIGTARAKELIFTARKINAPDGEKIGLVNHCVEPGEAFDKALEIAREILQQGPIAVKMAKIAVDRGVEVEASTGMVIEEACYAQTLHTMDRLEGLAAFAEKRKPSYKGE